jgi:hypothetical protein
MLRRYKLLAPTTEPPALLPDREIIGPTAVISERTVAHGNIRNRPVIATKRVNAHRLVEHTCRVSTERMKPIALFQPPSLLEKVLNANGCVEVCNPAPNATIL